MNTHMVAKKNDTRQTTDEITEQSMMWYATAEEIMDE